MIGVDRATLANYERGRRMPNDAVLKKLAEISGHSIPEFLFGSPRFDFKVVSARIAQDVAELAAKHPGYFPRWAISDDEFAIIVAMRLCQDMGLTIIETLASEAERVLASETEATGVPAYGESHVQRLRAAIARGHLMEGFDPDASLFATLIEERIEREEQRGE